MNQKAKSKDKTPEGSIPPNPPPSPVSSIGTPLEDEEPTSLTPTIQTTAYREYHSSDEASDPGGYKLTKKVQPQAQLATDQCTDTYLVDYEPLDTDTEDSDIKIIDFGLGQIFCKCSGKMLIKMKSKVGTPAYVSPEILQGKYDEKCDMCFRKLQLFKKYHLDKNYRLYIRYQEKIDPSSLSLVNFKLDKKVLDIIYRNKCIKI